MLLQREKEDFKNYWESVEQGAARVKYHTDLDFAPGEKDLVLVDEADMLLLADIDGFFEFVAKTASIVCFTATTG